MGFFQVAGILDSIRSTVDDRGSAYDSLVDAIESSRAKKDLSILQAAKKKSEAELKKLTQQVISVFFFESSLVFYP